MLRYLHSKPASGPWGGAGGTAPHNLVRIGGSDANHTQVVLHELGHILNMVPNAGYYKAQSLLDPGIPAWKTRNHARR